MKAILPVTRDITLNRVVRKTAVGLVIVSHIDNNKIKGGVRLPF